LQSPLADPEEDARCDVSSQQGSRKPSPENLLASSGNLTTADDDSAAGICFSVFDDEEGSIPIFYSGIHSELSEKIAFKSIVSTTGVCFSVVDDEASAIIPFPEEKVLGFVIVFSLEDKQARGAARLASLTLVYHSKNRDQLFSSFNTIKEQLSEMIDHIKTLYHYGRPIPSSLVNELKEIRLLSYKIGRKNEANLADEVIATWLGKQLDGHANEDDRTASFDSINNVHGAALTDLMSVLGHPVNLKLLQYFHQNPTTFDGVKAIASQIGYCPASVDQAATALVKAGLLYERRVGRIRVVSLNLSTSRAQHVQRNSIQY